MQKQELCRKRRGGTLAAEDHRGDGRVETGCEDGYLGSNMECCGVGFRAGLRSSEQGSGTFLFVSGMRCGSCAAVVRNTLSSEPNVTDVSVSLLTGLAYVRYNSVKPRSSKLVAEHLAQVGICWHPAPSYALAWGVSMCCGSSVLHSGATQKQKQDLPKLFSGGHECGLPHCAPATGRPTKCR